MKTVLIGWPVEHSISPAMHNAAYRELGMDGMYSVLPVEHPQELGAVLARLKADPDWIGANVTVPHKQNIIPLLDSLEGGAVRLRAVNTIVRDGSRLTGRNTDMPGFLSDLDRNGLPYRGSRALVIGSGGAARAVVLGLVDSGCSVTLAAVVRNQAEALADELGAGRVSVRSWDDPALPAAMHGAALVVNASPVGMWPKVEDSPWPRDLPWPAGAAAYDLVYNPQETAFLRQARAAGMRTASGLGMLVEQGALAFEVWTGRTAPRDVMRAAALRALSGKEH
jgi:shikimate dehydrogenase